ICTPAFTKSARFRVATARPWTTAVAAMRLSLIGMAFPVVRRRASSSAHFRPVSASQGRQWRRLTPSSNQRSRAVRFLPLGRIRIPNRSSPRTTGSTALSRSERWRQPSTSQRIRRLRVDGHEEVLLRTGEQPVDGTLVLRSRTPDEAIVPTIETLDVELLPRFDTVHPPELCRQNDLALGGDDCLHGGKISSYLRRCRALRTALSTCIGIRAFARVA